MRPKFRYRTMNCPARFPADLYLVDWLDHQGIEVDFITDHDLHADGPDLLRPYSVVLSSSHHEYWTAPMLDAPRDVPRRGRPVHVPRRQLAVRRDLDGSGQAAHGRGSPLGRAVAVRGAARRSATTRRRASRAGIWKNRGRAPNTIVGRRHVAARASTAARPTCASPSRTTRRVRLDLRGHRGRADRRLADLQVKWGAAGYEFDRVESELGSPGTTVILGSSVRFNATP